MTMYYTELDGAEPTVSIQVKEVKYTLTQESLVNIIEQKDSFKEMLELCQRNKKNMIGDVKAFFEAVYTDNKTDMSVSVDDVNELLVGIGADPFSKSWSALIKIAATVTGVESTTSDNLRDLILDNIEVEFTSNGDIWVDDINVHEIHAES